MQSIHYVVGDIHGEFELLDQLLYAIQSHHHWHYPGKPGHLVYLGDYVDRGPSSRQVICGVLSGVESLDSVFLKGNHEDLLIRCLVSWSASEKLAHSLREDRR